MKKFVASIFAIGAFAPALAVAQNFDYVNNWLDQGYDWLRYSITIIMILMTVWFLITVFRFIANKDAGKAGDLRKLMINGAIGLFVSVAIWGIIRIAGNVLGVDTKQSNIQDAPRVTCPPGLNYDIRTRTCL